jgi:hypothetical protein
MISKSGKKGHECAGHCFGTPNFVLDPITCHIGVNRRELDPLLTIPAADTILLNNLYFLFSFQEFLPFRFA